MPRPRIICHMTSSIDGRLLVDRWLRPNASAEAEHELIATTYDSLAAQYGADGWMVGRVSMEPFTSGSSRNYTVPQPDLRQPFIGDRKGRHVAVGIDVHGKLHYGQDNVLGDHAIAILGPDVPDIYLAELRHDGVSYLLTPATGPEEALRYAMDVLGDTFGIQTLLLQGGGITNGTFLKAGLIDEISLIIYPGIDGLAGIPSIFEYEGGADELPAAGQLLRHLATETLESGLVWLRYAVEKST